MKCAPMATRADKIRAYVDGVTTMLFVPAGFIVMNFYLDGVEAHEGPLVRIVGLLPLVVGMAWFINRLAIDRAAKERRSEPRPSTFEDRPLLMMTLDSGKDVPIFACSCKACESEWFSFGYSKEFLPSLCPYCGKRFDKITFADENPIQR